MKDVMKECLRDTLDRVLNSQQATVRVMNVGYASGFAAALTLSDQITADEYNAFMDELSTTIQAQHLIHVVRNKS